MKKLTLKQLVKQFIAGVGFRLFIWGSETTEERYWKEIQHQENAHDKDKEAIRNAMCSILTKD